MKLNGEGVCYPAFLLGRPEGKPIAFSGPGALFISGRLRGPIGPMDEDTLVDSSGRTWTLSAITAIGRWGSLTEILRLWWRREYLVEFEAAEGSRMSLDDLKAWLLHKAELSEAALRADTEVDEQVRQYFLEGWSASRKALEAAQTFQAVAKAMGPYSLYRDSWFSWRGRSNRAEYLAVFLFNMVLGSLASLAAQPNSGPALILIGLAFGTVLPMLLGWAVIVRRTHDIGLSVLALLVLLLLLALGGAGIERAYGSAAVWFEMAATALVLMALAVIPGTVGENRFDPQPNPGPSL